MPHCPCPVTATQPEHDHVLLLVSKSHKLLFTGTGAIQLPTDIRSAWDTESMLPAVRDDKGSPRDGRNWQSKEPQREGWGEMPPAGNRHLAIGRPWVTALQFHYLGIAEDKGIPHLTSYLKVMVVICEHNYSVLDMWWSGDLSLTPYKNNYGKLPYSCD